MTDASGGRQDLCGAVRSSWCWLARPAIFASRVAWERIVDGRRAGQQLWPEANEQRRIRPLSLALGVKSGRLMHRCLERISLSPRSVSRRHLVRIHRTVEGGVCLVASLKLGDIRRRL